MLAYSKDDLLSDDEVSSEQFQNKKDDLLEEKKKNIEENIPTKLSYSSSMPLKEKSKELAHKDGCEIDLSDTPRGKFILEAIEKAQNKWFHLKEKNEIQVDQIIPVCEMPIEEFAEFAQLFPRNCLFDDGIVYMTEMIYLCHNYCCEYIKDYFKEILQETAIVSTGISCRLEEKKGKEPDIEIRPIEDREAKPNEWFDHAFSYATIAMEIADFNESLDKLRRELIELVGPYTAILMAMGFKITRTEAGYAIKFLICRRACENIDEYDIGVVDENKTPIDRTILPSVALPLSTIFDDSPIPDLFKDKESIDLELPKLSNNVLRALELADRNEKGALKMKMKLNKKRRRNP